MPDAAVNRSAQTTSPTVKKKPLATGDPAAQPNANARPAIQASRLGPRFAIRAVWEPPVDPTIAPTQANGRILPPAHPYGAVAEFGDGSQLGRNI
jgi:hypothetical protein